MARLLPHLTRELENELIAAVQESNDGYPHHLEALRNGPLTGDLITDEDIDDVSDALWEGEQEGRDCGRDEEWASPYTSTRYADELPEADFYGEG
jgi:hypothetical protein